MIYNVLAFAADDASDARSTTSDRSADDGGSQASGGAGAKQGKPSNLAHKVKTLPNGQTQLFIGLHLIHEVTSPQAFDMLRERGLEHVGEVVVPEIVEIQLSEPGALEVADQEMQASFASFDFKEGVDSFVEKRPAKFQGR